jgi:chemotaxis protein MotA
MAFVAMIYGLVTANMKDRLMDETRIKQMIIDGLITIQNGENPHFIEQRLRSYLQHNDDKKTKQETKCARDRKSRRKSRITNDG